MIHLDELTDEEIVEAIVEHLSEDGRVNTDFIKVECHDARPVISGRVASDEDLDIVNEILTDVLEIDNFENNVWVDDTLAFESTRDDAKSEDEDEEEFEEEEEDAESDEKFEEEDEKF